MKGLIVETDRLDNINPLVKVGGSAGLPCFHFPLIYFPVSFMLRRGVKDITLALTKPSIETAQSLFGSGRHLGVNIRYKILDDASFLAQEILEDTDHFRGHSVVYTSANTVLWGKDLRNSIKDVIIQDTDNATIFGKNLDTTKRFEKMLIDPCGQIVSFDEDCKEGYTCQVVPKAGLYPRDIVEIVESLSPEFIAEELRPINTSYLNMNRLDRIFVHADELWFQVDCFHTLNLLSKRLREYYTNKKIIIGSPERNAYQSGLIGREQFELLVSKYSSEEFRNLMYNNLDIQPAANI
jgi:glucose-1-phosphate thymidylyltransferase